jgi:hypothetical protein
VTGPAGTGDAGLGWHVDGDRLVLVVSAASSALRRELGPTAWSVLETLGLAARPTAEGELAASANAREIATAVGIGRDAATKALAVLRDRDLIVMEQPRREGGQFRTARYAIRLPRVVEAPPAARRARTIAAHRRVETPTLFDTPAIDTDKPEHDDHPPDARRPADSATDDSPHHSPPSPPDSRDQPHTLALSMRTAGDSGNGVSC